MNQKPENNAADVEQPYEQPLYSGIYRQVQGLAPSLDAQVLADLMTRLFGAIEHTTTALSTQDPPSLPIACKAGCSYCCSVQVQVLPPEVLNLFEHLKRTRTASQLTELTAQVAALDDRIHGLSPAERAQLDLPCALLVDGNCSVYEVRPLSCRSANSSDAGRCQSAIGPNATSGSVGSYVHQTTVCRQVAKALATGMRDAGYFSEALELISALRLALEHPDPLPAWQRGEPIFEDAQVAQ